METVFQMAGQDLSIAVDGRRKALNIKEYRTYLTDAELNELEKLNEMNPWYDIQMSFNYMDTHAEFVQHENSYRKMFPDELFRFYENTGLNL